MGHLRSMHRSCCRHGRTFQFWANALHDDPEQLWNLPPGVIAMEYGHTVFIAFQFFHSFVFICIHLYSFFRWKTDYTNASETCKTYYAR